MQLAPSPRTHDDTDSPANDVRLVCAGDCPAQQVEWLWPEKIPLGKVTLLVGDPGTGKSLLALDIAARLSRAAPWPEATATNEKQSLTNASLTPNPQSAIPNPQSSTGPASTLILSATDDIADTIRPRLDAAGADPHRVFFIPTVADLRDDFAQLRAAVDAAPNCRLIVIDPINAYVGASDSHFQTVVQKVLAPLAELAAEKRIAVLAIAHLRKTEGAAIYRAAGSMGFVAAARSVWTICRDPKTPGRHLLVPLKNNLTPTACGLAYSIQSAEAGSSARIAWEPTTVHETLDTIVGPKKRGPQAIELEEASNWLRTALAGGPRPANEVCEQGEQFGFQQRTLRRALHNIGGDTQFHGILEGWWWSLPNPEGPNAEAAEIPLPFREGLGEGSTWDEPLTALNHHPQQQYAFEQTPLRSDEANTHETASPQIPSPFPPPPSPKPVPLPTTCPLPRNTSNVPTPNQPAEPPGIPASIDYLNRVDRCRRADRLPGLNRVKGRHQSPRRKRKRTQLPPSAGDPVLDQMLDDLAAQLVIPRRQKTSQSKSPRAG